MINIFLLVFIFTSFTYAKNERNAKIQNCTDVDISIIFDRYAEDISWKIEDNDGKVMAHML